MSEENVELARHYIEAFNAEGLEGTEHLRHPDIEVFDPPEFPDAGRYVGEAAGSARVRDFMEMGWDGQFHNPEFIDANPEIAVIWEFRIITAHGGGFPLEAAQVHLLLFEEGKVRRIRIYLDKAQALEAAGLTD